MENTIAHGAPEILAEPKNLKGIAYAMHCKRNRRVAPANNLSEKKIQISLPANSIAEITTKNVEIFATRTHIRRLPPSDEKPPPFACRPTTTNPNTNTSTTKKSPTRLNRTVSFIATPSDNIVRNGHSLDDTPVARHHHHSDVRLQSSLRHLVHLEQHGFIVTPAATTASTASTTATTATATTTTTTAAQQEKPEKQDEYILSRTQYELKRSLLLRRRFNAIRWLLKPFRSRSGSAHGGGGGGAGGGRKRSRTPQEPARKVNAVVFKTYFVRWCTPPVRRRSSAADMFPTGVGGGAKPLGLKRAHSAFF